VQDDAVGKRLGADEAKLDRLGDIAPQVDPAADGDRVHVEHVLVHEAVGGQRGQQRGPAHEQQVAARLPLELGDLSGRILSQHGGVRGRAGEGGRGHVLG
jgi:hypothetical protein